MAFSSLFYRQHSMGRTEWFDSSDSLSPSTICLSLPLTGCYGPPLRSSTLHTHVAVIYRAARWVGFNRFDDRCRLEPKSAVRRWYVDEYVRLPMRWRWSTATSNQAVSWLYWSVSGNICNGVECAFLHEILRCVRLTTHVVLFLKNYAMKTANRPPPFRHVRKLMNPGRRWASVFVLMLRSKYFEHNAKTYTRHKLELRRPGQSDHDPHVFGCYGWCHLRLISKLAHCTAVIPHWINGLEDKPHYRSASWNPRSDPSTVQCYCAFGCRFGTNF